MLGSAHTGSSMVKGDVYRDDRTGTRLRGPIYADSDIIMVFASNLPFEEAKQLLKRPGHDDLVRLCRALCMLLCERDRSYPYPFPFVVDLANVPRHAGPVTT